jgi:hypothetical protein
VIVAAKPFEIIERGHFQIGTRQRRWKFLGNRVAIFSNRWMRRKRPSPVQKLRARECQGLDSARSERKARARRGRRTSLHECGSRARSVIPCENITSCRANMPWVRDFQVEQDLVISHALVEILSKPDLLAALAFRGGTALHKLHIKPPARYPRTSTWSKSRREQSDKRSRRCGAFAIPEGADLAGEDSPFVAYG